MGQVYLLLTKYLAHYLAEYLAKYSAEYWAKCLAKYSCPQNLENENLVKSGLVELESNPCQQSEIKDLELSSRSKIFVAVDTFWVKW